MDRPSNADIRLWRDAILACTLRRHPEAMPAPGTSVYAALESAGMLFACLATPEATERLRTMLEEDEADVIGLQPTAKAYTRIRDQDGKITRERSKIKDDWPCVQHIGGS